MSLLLLWEARSLRVDDDALLALLLWLRLTLRCFGDLLLDLPFFDDAADMSSWFRSFGIFVPLFGFVLLCFVLYCTTLCAVQLCKLALSVVDDELELFVVCSFEKTRFSTKPYQTAKTSEGREKERKINR